MLQRHLKEIDIEEIYPNDYNPNRMKPGIFDKLVEDIRRNGVLNPLHVYQKGDRYIIIDGEHRYKAAKLLGLKKLMCFVYTGEIEEIKKIISLRLNVLHGTIDPATFALNYKEYLEKYGPEGFADLVGFNEEVWERLRKDVLKIINDMGLPKQTVKRINERIKKAKTLDKIVEIVNEVLTKYGSTLQNYGFVSFSDGTNRHIYIEVDNATFTQFSNLLDKLAERGMHIRSVLIEFIKFANDNVGKMNVDEEMTF